MIIEAKEHIVNPRVSVAVITYNHGKYIANCLEHILAQKTDFAYEIVIADDCSKDNTRDILEAYQQRYPEKIKLLFQDSNLGLIGNYTSLLKNCVGTYIAQISGDDYWCDEQKLQKQVEALEQNSECDLCYTNTYSCDDDGVVEKRMMLKKNEITFESHLFAAGYFAPLSWMFRREVLDYAEWQSWFTDESFALALDVLAKSKIYFIDEPMTVYRCRMGSAASPIQTGAKWRYHQGILRMQLYYAEKYKLADELLWKLRMQIYATYYLLAYEAGDEKFMKEAEDFFAEAGLNMNAFIASGKEYVDYKKQFIGVKQSHAYNLGKKLLKAFKALKG